MKGRHVLITGHTGFKGSWLLAMLHTQGAIVSGISLDPDPNGIFQKAELGKFLTHDLREDIREAGKLTQAFQKVSPEIVIHLAAQPLVLASHENPQETYETNVIGTLNILQAVQATPSIKATLIITTDKVYKQVPGNSRGFVETDPLGAADPYSTSKAMADLLTQSWMKSHPGCKIAIARAGNVIGGGDVAANRLLPDLMKSFSQGKKAQVRNPKAVRPWQHVLDCLTGYAKLAEALIDEATVPTALNFGPDSRAPLNVREVSDMAAQIWGDSAEWSSIKRAQLLESEFLTLDATRAKEALGWSEKLSSSDAIHWTVEWEKRVFRGEEPLAVTMDQLDRFLGL